MIVVSSQSRYRSVLQGRREARRSRLAAMRSAAHVVQYALGREVHKGWSRCNTEKRISISLAIPRTNRKARDFLLGTLSANYYIMSYCSNARMVNVHCSVLLSNRDKMPRQSCTVIHEGTTVVTTKQTEASWGHIALAVCAG